MSRQAKRPRAAVAGVIAVAIAATGCTGTPDTVATNPVIETVATSPSSSSSAPPVGMAGLVVDLAGAAALVQEMSSEWVAYVGSAVATGEPDSDLAAKLAALYDSDLVTFDAGALGACVIRELDALDQAVGRGLWEHSSWRDHGAEIAAADGTRQDVWTLTVLDNLVAGAYDGSAYSDVVVGPQGVVGHVGLTSDPEGGSTGGEHLNLVRCLEAAVTASPEAQALLDHAAQPAGLAAMIDGNYDARAFFSNVAGDTGGVAARRPGFPADPANPEPIASTGSNKWDLITTDDPSAFVCAAYLGQGPEEFLPASKDGGYERVQDAYLYRAKFSDGTVIDMRVHSEIGSQADADAELDRYLVPLGQLPTVLRRNIGRFAVRLGDNTATASQGEGMMLQAGNAAVRLADNRLEETLFHESVHTSLDSTYSYQRSQEWMDAQAADSQWLTEYGRENPDSEDLAETALYALAVLHHPQRLPAGMADEVSNRIPNRLKFIEQIFPLGDPLITPTDATVTCNG